MMIKVYKVAVGFIILGAHLGCAPQQPIEVPVLPVVKDSGAELRAVQTAWEEYLVNGEFDKALVLVSDTFHSESFADKAALVDYFSFLAQEGLLNNCHQLTSGVSADVNGQTATGHPVELHTAGGTIVYSLTLVEADHATWPITNLHWEMY